MDKIPLIEYAKIKGLDPGNTRRKAAKGNFETAEKIGRDWFIDPNEPYIDNRIRTGEYKDWRNKANTKKLHDD